MKNYTLFSPLSKYLAHSLAVAFIALLAISTSSQAQVTLNLEYTLADGQPTTVPSGEYWTMKLKYTVSSTSGSATGVKIVIPMPDAVHNATGFVGTLHAPSSNFVFTSTPGAKKLTITFISPIVGATGDLFFKIRTTNGITPNNSTVQTCAELTADGGFTSGSVCHTETITAGPVFCGSKTLEGGGAIDNTTTYRIKVGFDKNYPSYAPTGALNLSDISLTDTYPAGAEFVSAKLYHNDAAEIPTTVTQSGNSVTVAIPNYIIGSSGSLEGGWQSNSYEVRVTVKYNSSTFSSGQPVTNSASITFTPLGGSPTTITNGSTVGGCTSDLIETHTLVAPTITASLTKSALGVSVIHPDEVLMYHVGFTNTGNVPLENVRITETVPTQLSLSNDGTYASHIFFHGGTGNISGLEYQTNTDSNWTNWVISGAKAFIPTLPSGEYITKYRVNLISPLPPNAGTGIIMLAFKGNATTTSQNVNNCVEWTSATSGIPTDRTTCANVTLEPTPTTARVFYTIGNTPGCQDPYALNQVFDFWGHVKALIGYSGLQNPTVAMFLPAGFDYVPGSETFDAKNSGITAIPTLTVTPNFGGGTRTLYRWTFPNGTVLPANTEFVVHVDIKAGPKLAPGTNYSSDTWFMVEGSNIGILAPENIYAASITDQYDWDGDGNTTEKYRPTATDQTSCGFRINGSAAMESIKWVKGLCDTDYSKYPNFGQTVPGGNADYKLIVKNVGNVTMKDIKIIDILPFIGDRGVIDTSPRSTAWTPNLADPIAAPAGITVYYSTSGNPCRDEMKSASDPSPFPTGCETANWTTTPPSNITTVKSVKIDFGTTTLAGGDSLVFSWPMRAPINAPTNNEIAWNSFGFVATRTDNNDALLAAEPNKVGIKVKAGAPAYYGNRVWYDTNKDGIQDPTEGGVDGVKVKLFKVSSLTATPNPATDQLVNFTITGNGGFYKFSNLQPGFYYAVFCVPTGYLISPKNTGTDITVDSDGASTTYQSQAATITAVTELVSTEDDDTWDQGIYCTFSPVVTTNSPVAVGGTLTMSVSPSTGSYTWSGPNGWTATGASVTKSNITLADSGSYAVSVYQNPDGTGCWANINIKVVVGTCTKPAAGADKSVCAGTSTTLTGTAPTTGTWSAQTGNPAGATLGTTTGGIATVSFAATATGSYKFIYNVSANCQDTMTVTVNAKPVIANGAATICAGETVDLTSKITGYATLLSPVWTVATAGGTAVATPTAVKPTANTTYVLVAQNASGCKDTAQVVVTVNPKPNAGTDQTLACANAAANTLTTTATLTPTPTGGTWAQIGTTPATATITGNNVTGMSVAGTYQFVYTLNGCKDTVAVTVSPCAGCVKPNAGADQSVCAPATTATLTGFTPAGGTWSAQTGNPAAATVSATGAVSGMSANGVYKFIYSVTSGGQTCTDTVQVTRNAKPVIGDATICSPATTATVTLTPTGGTWSAMAGNPATATVSATGAVSGLTADGTYRFIYTLNGCSDTSTVVRNAKPNAGADQTLACANAAANTLTTTATLTPTPTGGTWAQIGTTPATATITGNAVTGMSVAGTYQFVYTLNGCKDTVAVTVSPCAGCVKPNAGADQSICAPATTATLTGFTPAGGTWSAQTGNPAAATVSATGAVSGMSANGVYKFIYSVTSGGQTCTDTVQVTRNAKPNAGNDQTLACANAAANTLTTTATLAPTPTGGTWTQIGTTPATATITGNNVTGMSVAGTYQFVYTLNGCKDTVAVTVSPCAGCVKPNAGADQSVCAPATTATLTGFTPAGGTWSAQTGNPAAATVSATGAVSGMSANGVYKFIYSVTSGGQTCTDTVQVTRNAKPNAGADQTLACANAATNTLTTTATLAPTPAGGTWAQIGTTPATATITGNNVTGMSVAGSYQFVYTLNGCKDTVAVTVSPCAGCVKPNAGADAAAVCQPITTAKLTAVTAGGTWAPIGSPANPAPATIDASGNIVGMTAVGTYKFVYSVTGGGQTCTDTAQVVVNPKLVIADAAVTICAGDKLDLNSKIANYATLINPVWTVSVIDENSPITTYVLDAENSFGCKDTANVVVTVNPKPNAGADVTLTCPASGIAPTTATLTPVTADGTWTQIGTTPATAIISGNSVSGLTVAGTYKFVYSVTSGGQTCTDTAAVIVPTCVVPKGSLGDYVWKDANNNGIQGDAGDSPVKGVILELYKNGVATGITDTTDVLGKYLFVISDSASYQVQILTTSLPANCTISTLQNAGSDDTKDSDFNPTTGLSDAVVVNPSNPLKRDVLTVDAALVVPCVPSTITITTPAACSANYATYSVTVSVANPLTSGIKVNAGTVSGSNPYTISGIPIGTNLMVVDSLNATCKSTITVNAPNCNCTPALPLLLNNSFTVCAGDTFPTLRATVVGMATVEWFMTATGGTAVATGLTYKPAGVVPAVGDTLWAQARSTDPTCPTAISTTRVPAFIIAQNCEKIVDLALKKMINTKVAKIGDELTYTIQVYNQSSTGATGVEVRDTIATTVQFVTGSLVASRGSANITGNVISWNIGGIAANGDTVTLTYKVKAIASGIHYNTAEISKTNEKDVDSTPGNGKPAEDDIDNQCFTVPFKLCPGEKVQASVPSTLTNVQWFKDGGTVAVATGNVVLLSEVGTYTFTATNNTCPASGCCPVIIEPSQNCCPVNLCVPVTIRKIKN